MMSRNGVCAGGALRAAGHEPPSPLLGAPGSLHSGTYGKCGETEKDVCTHRAARRNLVLTNREA